MTFLLIVYQYLCNWEIQLVPVLACTNLLTLIDDSGLHYLYIATVIADCFTVKDYRIILLQIRGHHRKVGNEKMHSSEQVPHQNDYVKFFTGRREESFVFYIEFFFLYFDQYKSYGIDKSFMRQVACLVTSINTSLFLLQLEWNII